MQHTLFVVRRNAVSGKFIPTNYMVVMALVCNQCSKDYLK